jgi:putative ABC transport system permease protein
MLLNYLKIAWRNLVRNKMFSVINVLGLSLGMACCMLLLLYIRSELVYDKHHQRANDLYLVNSQGISSSGDGEEWPMLSAPYAQALQAEFPEVEQVTRLLWADASDEKVLLQAQQRGKPVRAFYETKGYQADSTFFNLFTYEFTEGDSRMALNAPNSVVLSEPVARKLFGNAPALNQLVKIGGATGRGEPFRVTGVYRDESSRSHIDARFFVSLSVGNIGDMLRRPQASFSSNNIFYTYLRLRPDADVATFTRKLPAFVDKYAGKDLKAAGFNKRLFLTPVTKLHLYSQLRNVVTPTSSATYLYLLASIAVFTLLIACVNFMNLSTARAVKRAGEVGVRKVLGAGQQALIRQFLGESMGLSFTSLVFAIGLVLLTLSTFNQLTQKQLPAADLADPVLLLAFLGLALLTGLLAGSYPAFYLSRFNPVQVLKGRFVNGWSAVALRRGLVVFQFVIAVSLILATLVIERQMRYIREKPLGFTQQKQIAIPLRSSDAQKLYSTYRNEIVRNSQVIAAAGAFYYPGIANPNTYSFYRPDQRVDAIHSVKVNPVDYDFLQTMDFRLVAGRLFSRQFPGDTNNRLVVNQATLRTFSIPTAQAIGKKLNFTYQGQTNTFEIVGVVSDFHFEDLHQPIQPFAFVLNNRPNFNFLVVHVNTANLQDALGFLEKIWKTLDLNEPFTYSLVSDDFQRNYSAEARTSRIVSSFTLITILISCLGLFGLATFIAEQRTKEIGVRKVLGASVSSIVALLSKDFLKLVLIAIVIALPIAWYAMHQWLQGFAYKTDIEWWMFALAGVLAVGIALLTVSFQSVKAALMNPVKSLRSE